MDRIGWSGVFLGEEKMDRPHLCLLAPVGGVARELRGFTGRGRWLFPSAVETGLLVGEYDQGGAAVVGCRKRGYDGRTAFRSMASTTLNEHGWRWM